MHVQMMNRLPTVVARVEYAPKAGLRDPFRARYMARSQEHLTEKFSIILARFDQGCDMPLGNDEKVARSLWSNVPKDENVLRLMHDFSGNRTLDDATEQAILIGHDDLGEFDNRAAAAGRSGRYVRPWALSTVRLETAIAGSHTSGSNPSRSAMETPDSVNDLFHPALLLGELVELIATSVDRGLTAARLRTILEDHPDTFRILEAWQGPWRSR